jgi:lactobin A/cerein 7B family class IIb bacteriocin
MANFAELNAQEMNETNGGSVPTLPIKAVLITAAAVYTVYRAIKK